MAATDAQRAIEAVWRIESAKVVATVARMVRDVGLAEELAQDALVSALEHWPAAGVPDNPGAWLMTTAKHRALDWLRQAALHARKQDELGRDADARGDLEKALTVEGRRWVQGRAHLEIGKLALKTGNRASATEHLRTAVRLCESDNDQTAAEDAKRLIP